MVKIFEAINTALRDDATATVGLRAITGHSATPWGVHKHKMPEKPDFTSKYYIVFYFLGATPINDTHGSEARLREDVLVIDVYGKSGDQVEVILKRVRWLLENRRGVTLPTSEEELHAIEYEGPGPNLYDEEFNVPHRVNNFRVKWREDVGYP